MVSNPSHLTKLTLNAFYLIIGTEGIDEIFKMVNRCENINDFNFKASSPYFDASTAEAIGNHLLQMKNVKKISLGLMDGSIDKDGVKHIAKVFDQHYSQYERF